MVGKVVGGTGGDRRGDTSEKEVGKGNVVIMGHACGKVSKRGNVAAEVAKAGGSKAGGMEVSYRYG